MTLHLYNTATREKEKFHPLNPPQVKMYVCGPTVYDFLHIGNFRGPVVFNLLRNWLEHHGYDVSYAMNFTDVDDRIITRAKDEGMSPNELSEKFIQEYKTDFANLGLRPHEINPKVTEHMPNILSFIGELVTKEKAYVAGGDVLYSIESFDGYGKLSGRKTEDMIAGSRIEVDEKKHSPLDFALWKAAKPGEVSWESPWGAGRPGWHIECSAMIDGIFGEQIDIHGGGMDLIFPHHENEIAQSEGCSGKQFVKTWVHWNMLNLTGQKMSKSVGNILSLREFLEKNHAEVYKYMILSSHYRSVSDFGDDSLHRTISALARIYSSLSLIESLVADFKATPGYAEIVAAKPALADLFGTRATREHLKFVLGQTDAKQRAFFDEQVKKAVDALNDDLNTPVLISVFFDIVREVNTKFKRGMKLNTAQFSYLAAAVTVIRFFGHHLSLFEQQPSQFLKSLDQTLLEAKGLKPEIIEELVQKRSAARAAKDFAGSDEYRKQLTEMGINVSDTPQGSFWEVAK